MKSSLRILTTVAALVLASIVVPLGAGMPRDALLVSPLWLRQHLQDASLVLLHVGPEADYPGSHIPGARFLSLRTISRSDSTPGALTLEMPGADTLRAQLEALGVSDGAHIVVYGAKDWFSPPTRVVLTLLQAGLNVSLLDGGLEAWTKEGGTVTSAIPAARAGKPGPLVFKSIVVDADFVRSHANAPGFAIVDARDVVFYDGSREGGPADRRVSGHIPGARSVPYSEVTRADMTLKSAADLASVFAKAGVQAQDTVVAYCHIGQQATAVLFAARTLGHPILLYDGSVEDWARRGLPLENPAKQ